MNSFIKFLQLIIFCLLVFIIVTALMHFTMIDGFKFLPEFIIAYSGVIFTIILIYYNRRRKLKIFKINGLGYYTCHYKSDAENLVNSVISKCNHSKDSKCLLQSHFSIEEVSIDESKNIKVFDHSDITLYNLYKENLNARKESYNSLLVIFHDD